MKKKDYIILILFVILVILTISKCDRPIKERIITETKIERYTDTIIKHDTIYYTNRISAVKIDTIHVVERDTVMLYFTQDFKDTNYHLTTYSRGLVDSIDLSVVNREILVHDSIVVTNDIILDKKWLNLITANVIYVDGWGGYVGYNRKVGMFYFGGGVGIIEKKPILVGTVGVSF